MDKIGLEEIREGLENTLVALIYANIEDLFFDGHEMPEDFELTAKQEAQLKAALQSFEWPARVQKRAMELACLFNDQGLE